MRLKKKTTTTAKNLVVKELSGNRLGILEILVLGLLTLADSVKIDERYPGLYRGLEKLPDTFKTRLREGAQPLSITVPRRLPSGLREATRKELGRMEKTGVIEKVEEHR